MGRPRVLLADDHPLIMGGIRRILAPEVELVGTAKDGRELVDAALRLKPDIAIVDITLQGGSSGLELIKQLRAHRIAVPVLVLSMHQEELYAERVLQAGGKGYVSKDETSTVLMRAMNEVLSGRVYLSEKMTAAVLSKLSGDASPATDSELKALTDRQLEVFRLIGKGYNDREIAHQLDLQKATVDRFRAQIKERLRMKSAAEVYCRAAQWLQDQGE